MEYKGVGVSSGRSLGTAVIIKDDSLSLKKTKEFNYKEDVERFSAAVLSLIKEYDMIIESKDKDAQIVSLAEAYKMMISSPSLYEEIKELIVTKRYSAIKAVDQIFNEKAGKMAALNSDYAKERATDIRSLKKLLISKILGLNDINISNIDYDFILVSNEVTPSMLLSANPKFIKGIVSYEGSKTSHVAILSKNMGIPAVFSIPKAEEIIKNRETIYIDGTKGIVINELDSEIIRKYEEEINNYAKISESLNDMLDKKAKTIDGKYFEVAVNAGDINDLKRVIEVKPDGVGLFRSEFLYLNRDNPPSEELQFNVYKTFASTLKNKPIIIRTIDIGGDKMSSFFDIPTESNPFLGYRAIRYCLDHKNIFKTQLRAILRASNYGDIMIMYPMISNIEELRKANAILRETMAELSDEEITFNDEIKVGIMVEVPSVAVTADLFIDEVDFFSIGTNDLVQYTMAVDRTNALVTKLYDAYNPAVIKLIKGVIDSRKDAKFVGMCGEMAADPLYLILLVGLGIDELSVNVNAVLKVKKYISMLNYEECKKVVEYVLTLKTGAKIKSYLDEYAKEIFGIYLTL